MKRSLKILLIAMIVVPCTVMLAACGSGTSSGTIKNGTYKVSSIKVAGVTFELPKFPAYPEEPTAVPDPTWDGSSSGAISQSDFEMYNCTWKDFVSYEDLETGDCYDETIFKDEVQKTYAEFEDWYSNYYYDIYGILPTLEQTEIGYSNYVETWNDAYLDWLQGKAIYDKWDAIVKAYNDFIDADFQWENVLVPQWERDCERMTYENMVAAGIDPITASAFGSITDNDMLMMVINSQLIAKGKSLSLFISDSNMLSGTMYFGNIDYTISNGKILFDLSTSSIAVIEIVAQYGTGILVYSNGKISFDYDTYANMGG